MNIIKYIAIENEKCLFIITHQVGRLAVRMNDNSKWSQGCHLTVPMDRTSIKVITELDAMKQERFNLIKIHEHMFL